MKCMHYYGLLCGLLFTCTLQSQFYFSYGNRTEPEVLWELGVSAGIMNGITDIGGSNRENKNFLRDVNWGQSRWGLGLFAGASWHYQYALRLHADMGYIAGTDQVLHHATGIARNRYNRNLQFRTRIAELALLAELHPLMILSPSRNIPRLSPYMAAGFGLFHYNPQAWYNQSWVNLRPLHTEGQGFDTYGARKTYASFSWCLPAGIGIKYDAARLINLRLEMLYRFTGTDYLDDVSGRYADPALFSRYLSPEQSLLATQLADRSGELVPGAKNNAHTIRGNPANRDAYFSIMITVVLALGRTERKQA